MQNLHPKTVEKNIKSMIKSILAISEAFEVNKNSISLSEDDLDVHISELCNFLIIGGNATGTYQFQTGFYDLLDMSAEFQKSIELTVRNCTNTYAYLDDILIVTKKSLELHIQKLQTVLTKLDEKDLAKSLDKCKIACKQVAWIRYTINSESTIPLFKKQVRLKIYHH